MGGALTGAKLGSMFGPWGTGIGLGLGALSGVFGGGKSEAEKLAEQDLRNRMQRSNQAWGMATGDMAKARSYFSPIAGGSREAALEAAAPQIQQAQESMQKGRQTLFDLAARSGGAGAMLDPYAQSRVGTNLLTQQRPGAAQALANMGGTEGGWAQNMGQGAANTIFSIEWKRREEERLRGAGIYDLLESTLPGLKTDIGKLFGIKGGPSLQQVRMGSTEPFNLSKIMPGGQRGVIG